MWYITYKQKHEPPLALRIVIIITWYLSLVNIATVLLGAIGVPIVTALFIIAGLGFIVQWRKKRKDTAARQYGRRKSVFVDAYDMIQESIAQGIHQDSFDIKGTEDEIDIKGTEDETPVSPVLISVDDDDNDDNNDDGKELKRKSTVRFKSQSYETSKTPEKEEEGSVVQKCSSFDTWSNPSLDNEITGQIPEVKFKDSSNASNHIFLILITLCTLFIILRYPWLLLLLSPLGAVWCVKKLAQVTSIGYLCQMGSDYWIQFKLWCYTHQAKLFPQPIPTLLQLCKDIDGLALLFLKKTAGSFVSALIIIGLLLGSVALSAFLIFQIQLEISHSVGLAAQVLNASVEQSPFIHRYNAIYYAMPFTQL